MMWTVDPVSSSESRLPSKSHFLLAAKEGRVLAVDVARERDRHAESHLGHRQREYPAPGARTWMP